MRLSCALFLLAVAASPQDAAPREVSPHGASRDAAFPFFPSRLTTPDGAPAALRDYSPNETCLGCHEEIGKQWKGSMHAFALEDPVFRALTEVAHEATDGKTDRLCIGCHSPPAVLSGNGTPEALAGLGPPAADGVSCVVCHSVAGANLSGPDHAPANASLVLDPTGPIRGPNGRDCAAEGKATVASELHRSSAFCANCHGVVHPGNGFAVERTYEEWRSSIYAANDIQCQDCHMQPVAKAIETARTLRKIPNPGVVAGQPREHVYTHEFTGGSSALQQLLGAKGHARNTEALLQAAASLELELPAHVAAGDLVPLRVKVRNETAGHDLPTSLTQIRQMWLDVEVTDALGARIYRSGSIDERGAVDPDAVMFRAIAGDADGKPTTKPWEMAQFLYQHTVPPRGYTVERYAFAVPPDCTGPITVKATLRYRSFPQELVNRLLGKEAPRIPTVDMTSAEQLLPLR
ncbi:MAG: multiheme c-type cytochrome [Planctomycetota bacterium]